MTASERSLAHLNAHYASLESTIPVRVNADYENLVVPSGNAAEPVHRWFRFKEAYSLRLLPRVVKDLGLAHTGALRIVDPFAGSGTTAVAAADLTATANVASVRFTGYECNPFLHLVSRAKLESLKAPTQSFLPAAKRIVATVARKKVDPFPRPQLATFFNPDYFTNDDLRTLMTIRAAIAQEVERGLTGLDADLASLCLGAAVEPSSALRRDGRALRHVPDKQRAEPLTEFMRRAEMIAQDQRRRRSQLSGSVRLGDGRSMTPNSPRKGETDLVIFSPPYPNNIDYTEVYKMEAWALGYISTSDEFSSQRLRTVYSHPSIRRSSGYADFARGYVDSITAPLLEALPDDRYKAGRVPMIEGYVADMYAVMTSSARVLKPGGSLVYIVGNSAHGAADHKIVIAADLLMAHLARAAGLEVDRIDVARYPKRRRGATEYLRESVVFARRPAND